jgi:hypothetical protein
MSFVANLVHEASQGLTEKTALSLGHEATKGHPRHQSSYGNSSKKF